MVSRPPRPHNVAYHRDGTAWRYDHSTVCTRDPRVIVWWSHTRRTWTVKANAPEDWWKVIGLTPNPTDPAHRDWYASLQKPTTFRHDASDPGAAAARPASNQR